MSDLIGKIICGYRIVSQIGEGGMGKVYLGESAFLTEYKQQVAIKTLTSRGASERQAALMRDLFIREANIQVQLKHPHIVSVIQFAVEGDEHFLILEYLPGYPFQGRRMSNVADVIARELGPIPQSMAFAWFSQTLDAMSYAHGFRYRWQGEERVGIVHRDIKPANLLLVDPKTIKVSDFGIVKVHQRGVAITRNLTPGTSAYMSPEAILGPKQYGLQELDGRSDIYSLGISLFEMLTGKLPFKPDGGGSADSSLRRKQVGETPPPPSSILPTLSREIDAVVLRALEKHPDSRYQSAEEFKRAIQELDRKRLTVAIGVEPTAESAYETRPFFEGMEGTEVLEASSTSPRRAVGADGTEVLEASSTSPRIAAGATEVMPDVFLTTPFVAEPSTPGEQPLTQPRPGSRLYLWLVGVIAVVLLGAIAAIPLVNRLVSKSPPATTPTPVTTTTATPVAIPEGMVAIPDGSYLMGRDLTEDEKKFEVDRVKVFSYDYPAHQVQVKAFYIDRTEVSNREYSRFVNATNHAPPQNWPGNEPPQNAENIPVTYVNFLDATDFCAWRGKQRLPTEEEWEFAARGRDAGKPGLLRLYPWGDDWAEGHANTRESKLGYPQIVTANPSGASPFGVLNMAGNVYEWTATDFSHYPGSAEKTPREAGYQGVYQVVRGGSFDYTKEYAMTTTRVWARPTNKGPRLGFRCAADVK